MILTLKTHFPRDFLRLQVLLTAASRHILSLDCEFALREPSHRSFFLASLQALLVRGQSLTDSTGLLGSQIQRLVLLVLEQKRKCQLLGFFFPGKRDTEKVLEP